MTEQPTRPDLDAIIERLQTDLNIYRSNSRHDGNPMAADIDELCRGYRDLERLAQAVCDAPFDDVLDEGHGAAINVLRAVLAKRSEG